MKKIYLGSTKLKCHFKMFRVKYSNASEGEKVKQGVMNLMNGYLNKYAGKLINIKQLASCKEIIVYFVTGEEEPHPQWENYLKNTLLKNYNIITAAIQIGPRTA